MGRGQSGSAPVPFFGRKVVERVWKVAEWGLTDGVRRMELGKLSRFFWQNGEAVK